MNQLIAVDIGNTSTKIAGFTRTNPEDVSLPHPLWTVITSGWEETVLEKTVDSPAEWFIASVHRKKETDLVRRVKAVRPEDIVTSLSYEHADISIGVDQPELLGEDRIFAAVAANALRAHDQPAVVVDTGTAVTIDALSSTGKLLGGAILPGLAMSARALHENTDALPEIDFAKQPASSPGKNTSEAIRVGVIRGAAGAIMSLADSFFANHTKIPLRIIAGGDAKTLTPWLVGEWRHEPDLVVQGIATTAQRIIADREK